MLQLSFCINMHDDTPAVPLLIVTGMYCILLIQKKQLINSLNPWPFSITAMARFLLLLFLFITIAGWFLSVLLSLVAIYYRYAPQVAEYLTRSSHNFFIILVAVNLSLQKVEMQLALQGLILIVARFCFTPGNTCAFFAANDNIFRGFLLFLLIPLFHCLLIAR